MNASAFAARFPCVTMTPFGREVLPHVNWRNARSSATDVRRRARPASPRELVDGRRSPRSVSTLARATGSTYGRVAAVVSSMRRARGARDVRDRVVVAVDVLERELRVDRDRDDAREERARGTRGRTRRRRGRRSRARSPLREAAARRGAPPRRSASARDARGTSRSARSRPGGRRRSRARVVARAARTASTSVGGDESASRASASARGS